MTYQLGDEEITFQKGKPVGPLLRGWKAVRDNQPDQSWSQHFRIWGQPAAWADQVICSWVSDFLAEEYPQGCIQLVDCLGSQWSSEVLIKCWANQQAQIPIAPNSTSFLQVADTHIHSPLKAYIRQEKARLQEEWDREALATGQDRNARWGPYHVATVLGQALAKLQELQEKSDVVLKGFVQNQLLVFRPDEHHTFQLIDTCTAAWTQKAQRSPPGRGITPKSAGDRVWAWSRFQHWEEMGGPRTARLDPA